MLLEKATPDELLDAIAEYKVDRARSPRRRRIAPCSASCKDYDVSSLRKCVSAGEALPAATCEAWNDATGIEIIDGIGATEMLHIFISPER